MAAFAYRDKQFGIRQIKKNPPGRAGYSEIGPHEKQLFGKRKRKFSLLV